MCRTVIKKKLLHPFDVSYIVTYPFHLERDYTVEQRAVAIEFVFDQDPKCSNWNFIDEDGVTVRCKHLPQNVVDHLGYYMQTENEITEI